MNSSLHLGMEILEEKKIIRKVVHFWQGGGVQGHRGIIPNGTERHHEPNKGLT